MKQSILLIGGLVFGAFGAFAQQTPVSTTATNKNAVLEELTGIHCGYCPDGHQIANGLAAANPGRLILVNIHAGGYATPAAGEPDLRTTDGTAIDGFIAPAGYPQGAVSRTVGGDGLMAQSRGQWAGQVSSRLAEASPVNIAMNATIDASNRNLVLNVEMYYTATQSPGTTHYLNIGMLQNNFEGPQANYGNYNASAILPNGNYLHQHIFRGFLNAGGTWGDPIIATTGVITRTVTITLPASINTTDLNIGQLQFFAFLHEGHNTTTTSKIITGAEIAPVYTNVPPATATANGIINSFNVCDGESISPIIKVSTSGEAITALTFTTSVNGGSGSPYSWTGTIPTFGSADITMPAVVVNAAASNNVAVTITSVNGGAGNLGTTAMSQKIIEIATNAPTKAVIVKMTTDRYGSEVTWDIKNSAGTVVASGGPYTDAGASGTYPQPDVAVTLPANGCYKATVYDSYGDGFDSGYGNGDFQVLSFGIAVATVATFSGSQMGDAMFVNETVGLDENTAIANMKVYPNPASKVVNVNFEANGGTYGVVITDLSGRMVANTSIDNANGLQTITMPINDLAAGSYLISVSNEDGKNTQKFIVE